MRLVWAEVVSVLEEHTGIQRLSVKSDVPSFEEAPAICYPALSGRCVPGDSVLLNTTAVDLRLGTGGSHFVVARDDGSDMPLDEPSGGHVMKLRYTPLQRDVLSAEESGASRQALESADGLDGTPVVCCGLHSQIVHVAAAVREVCRGAKIAYVMTDAAALPAPLSDLLRAASEAGLIDATVTCGQAFGGDLEAVNLYSGLLAARHSLKADVAIVANGPGVVGTDTLFGHGGVVLGEAMNACGVLRGSAVACLRLSFADSRPRHYGVSHHTLLALSRIALAPATVAIPSLPSDLAHTIDTLLDDAGIWRLHRRAESAFGPDFLPDTRGVEVRTMGRGVAEDPAFFAAAAAAGDVAGRLLLDRED